MTNPTSNYSWQMPTSTDLVTDLPADFEVFGQAVDTTTKALNPSTTLGDIEYRSSTANTNTRLGIGTTNQVLSVVGGVPAWATISAGGMTLLSTTTLSGASTNITSISQSYKNLFVTVQNVTVSGGSSTVIWFDPNTATNASTVRTYTSTASAITSDTQSASGIYPWGNSAPTAQVGNANNSLSFIINDYASTTARKTFSFVNTYRNNTNTFDVAMFGGGSLQANTAISSIEFFHNQTAFTAGTVKIYGVS